MKKYFVYVHYNNDGEIFYIGKGCGKRAGAATHRNDDWIEEAKKGFEYSIVAEQLSGKQAFLIEQSLIRALDKTKSLKNHKIPADVVVPYWKKPKPNYRVIRENKKPTLDYYDKKIIQLQERIESNELNEEELKWLEDYNHISFKKLNREEQTYRTHLRHRLKKIKEANELMEKALLLKTS